MNIIESVLEPINGFLISISRDTINGWYDIEIGLPTKWVFASNEDITCEVINENDNGKLIKVSPLHHEVTIDNLVGFVNSIISTNKKIAEKEKEFTDKMSEMKNLLEQEAKKFYEELDDLKDESFKSLSKNKTKENKGKNKIDKLPESNVDSTIVITKEVVE